MNSGLERPPYYGIQTNDDTPLSGHPRFVSKGVLTVPPPDTEDARWFFDQVLPHYEQLRAYLRGSFPTVRDVDDLVQEAYLRLWKICAEERVRSAKGFLFHIARCVGHDAQRRNRRSPIIALADLSSIPVPDAASFSADTVCLNEELALLSDAIAALPPRCREIVVLRKLHQVPQRQVAARLGISEQTVQVQVQKGMKRCAGFLARRQVGSAVGPDLSSVRPYGMQPVRKHRRKSDRVVWNRGQVHV